MAESLIATTLGAELIETFNDPEYRPPPLPSVALELMSLSNRDDATIDRVVRLLEQDEMLAGGVMRLIGSPLYAGRSRIRSLKEAVVRLGVRTVRDLVFETALHQGVFALAEYSETIEQIRRHSNGHGVHRAHRLSPRQDRRRARLLVRALARHRFCGPVVRGFARRSRGQPAVAAALARHRSPARARLAHHHRAVALAAGDQEVVGHHHHLHTGDTSRISAAINLADQLSERFGASVVGPVDEAGNLLIGDAVDEFDLEVSRGELNLSDAAMKRIVDDAEATVPDILWL